MSKLNLILSWGVILSCLAFSVVSIHTSIQVRNDREAIEAAVGSVAQLGREILTNIERLEERSQ